MSKAIWPEWVYGLIGVWGIVSAFVLGLEATAAIWSGVIAGIVVVILAAVAWYGRERPPRGQYD